MHFWTSPRWANAGDKLYLVIRTTNIFMQKYVQRFTFPQPMKKAIPSCPRKPARTRLLRRYVSCLFLVLQILLALPALGQTKASQPHPVYLGFTVNEMLLAPTRQCDAFFVSGVLDIFWDPNSLPDFKPESIQFFNAVKEVEMRRAGLGKRPSSVPPGFSQASFLMSGSFKAYNSYTDFPFDMHQMGLIPYIPNVKSADVIFKSAPELLSCQILFPSLTNGLKIREMRFYQESSEFRQTHPLHRQSNEMAFAGIMFEVSRTIWPNLVRIILPMLVIWALGYSAHFWRDNSPVSRFGVNAMIAAILLSFGVRAYVPECDYLLSVNVAFLGLYLCIGFDVVMSIVTYRTSVLNDARRLHRVRMFALFASPALVLIVSLICMIVGIRGCQDNLFDCPPSVKVRIR